MSFLYPGFLFALIALAIPILIHLFNFRRYKKIFFSNVTFIREIKEETQSKSNLKHLLVLISRILALTFLVIAFAQPYIPSKNYKMNPAAKTVAVYIDNSFSMDAKSVEGRLLEIAKNRAYSIAVSYKPTDKFILTTNDFEGKNQHLVSRDQFVDMVGLVQLSPATQKLSEVMQRQKTLLRDAEFHNQRAYEISDFQKSVSDFNNLVIDTSILTTLIPVVAEEKENLYIDSVWFVTPVRKLDADEKMFVRIKNTSDKTQENIPLKLYINGKQLGLNSVTVPPNYYADSALVFTNLSSGIQHAMVQITDKHVVFDDSYFFDFTVAKTIPVHVISPMANIDTTHDFASILFEQNPLFELSHSSEDNIDYRATTSNNLIVLNGLQSIPTGLDLHNFLASGGSVAIFPGTNINLQSYNTFLSSAGANSFGKIDTVNTKVTRVFFNSPFYEGIFEKTPTNMDLPKVQAHYQIIANSHTDEEQLFALADGTSFLSKYHSEKGNLYVFSVGLSDYFSNLQKHALFVPTLLRIAELSYPTALNYFTIGNTDHFTINGCFAGNNLFKVSDKDFSFTGEGTSAVNKTVIPVYDMIKYSGNYHISLSDTEVAAIGANYNRSESDLSCYSAEELQDIADENNFSLINISNDNIHINYESASLGVKLWYWCILVVLIFLACEVLLLKFWET